LISVKAFKLVNIQEAFDRLIEGQGELPHSIAHKGAGKARDVE